MSHHAHGHDDLDMHAINECLYGDQQAVLMKIEQAIERVAKPIWGALGVLARKH